MTRPTVMSSRYERRYVTGHRPRRPSAFSLTTRELAREAARLQSTGGFKSGPVQPWPFDEIALVLRTADRHEL
jgi:hypothetical protein